MAKFFLVYSTVALVCSQYSSVRAQNAPFIEANEDGIAFGLAPGMALNVKNANGDVSNVAMAQDVTDAQKTLNSTLNQQLTDAMATVMQQMMKMNDTLQALQAENSNLRQLVEATNAPTTSTPTTSSPTSAPTPAAPAGMLGSQTNPAKNCREIWEMYARQNTPVDSGSQWLDHNLDSGPFQVYCEMKIRTTNGKSGFTLCGKYDRNAAGSRWLSQGFGRAANYSSSMKDLAPFGKKWASIDCRPLIDMQSNYMMHAASAIGNTYTKYLFTDIMIDVRLNSTNFFDTDRDGIGSCTARNAGGINTWDSDWEPITNDKGDGACLIGDGHHFCTSGRSPALTNARRIKPINESREACEGSDKDNIFWAWNDDDHGCATGVIGTGCNKRPPKEKMNYLFIH